MFTQVSCHPKLEDVKVTTSDERVCVSFDALDQCVSLYFDSAEDALRFVTHVVNRVQAVVSIAPRPDGFFLSFPQASEFARRVDVAVADRSER